MLSFMLSQKAMKLAAAALVAASLGACASKTDDADALNGGLNGRNAAGAAVPGSAQDFVVNIGDRVFFETDSTELTSAGVATLDKQAKAEQTPAKPHAFTLVKQLTLLGFFTSKIGATEVLVYDEIPGGFEDRVPYKKGTPAWGTT